jgi:hypothetical protein
MFLIYLRSSAGHQRNLRFLVFSPLFHSRISFADIYAKRAQMLYAVVVSIVGVVFLLAASASLGAGFLFKETALLVFGPLFLALLGYCLGACLATAALCRKRAASLQAECAPSVIAVGGEAAVLLAGGAAWFWTPPAILARYMMRLETLDGRVLEAVFPQDFLAGKSAAVIGEARGAYFGERDYLFIGDVFGFFKIKIKTLARYGERLFVYPAIDREEPAEIPRRDGNGHTVKTALVPNDDLIEQRQYVPGDDPRRINWKLYGHAGELFVREGEKRGQPLPDITVVIDTRTAPDKKNKRETADDLCRRALERTVAASRAASSVTVYYRGGGEAGRRWTAGMERHKLYALFALPFVLDGEKAPSQKQGLPEAPFMPEALTGHARNAAIVVRDA